MSGLIEHNGIKYHCEVIDPCEDPAEYTITRVHWDSICDEYLADYKKAYGHWFYRNGSRSDMYNGGDLKWFADKWEYRNPITGKMPHRKVIEINNRMLEKARDIAQSG